MRKVLNHIFVVTINFYILTYLLGIGLMILSMINNGLKPILGFIALLITLTISIIYETTRQKYKIQSFGEHLIGNIDKTDILKQEKNVTITRIPLFILIILTFAISGNILDGLSDGQIFSLGTIILFSILTICSYYGMKNFLIYYKLESLILIISGQMLTGLAFKYSPKAELTGDLMFKLYTIISITWIIIGLIYILKRNKATNA